ncbi:MAG: outer membrane beta-barrel protein, partial [Candidatus Baltobacteraceae bacterium]
NVRSRGVGNLVQPNITADEYTVSGEQLDAASLGNDMHKTLYQYIQVVPGITASSFQGQPRIHGGSVTDEQYEFDGIPIRERMTGFFTTNLSNVGIANVQVYTGGLDASQAAAGLGVINTVVKSGSYPGYARFTYGSAIDGSLLNNFTFEWGGATSNRRYSWYGALDNTDANNTFASGMTYPAMAVEGYNGPGPVKTIDLVANLHYRPDERNDFQFLIQNGVGTFDFNYLMSAPNGSPQPVTALPCPGYTVNPNTASGASGGLAPNGQTCPIGLYFGQATANGANNWYHYSGIGKIQWNHILNDHSNLSLRFAENFNQYIFQQPVVDANIAAIDNSPDFQTSAACTALFPAPYSIGTPIQTSGPGGTGSECQQQQNWFSTGYYGDRRSNMYLGSLDYTNNLNANTTLKAGIGDEVDNNLWNTYFSFYFNGDGSWPGDNSSSTYPDHVIDGYVDLSSRIGKFRLDPGILYQRMTYDYPAYGGKPGGPFGVGIWNPTFSLTYTMNPSNVIRGSYTDSTSFVGTGYVYRQGSSVYSPSNAGSGGIFSASPTMIHSYDLQWEHQFDPDTSLKFGPYFNKSTNVFQIYRPVNFVDANGEVHYKPAVATNNGFRQSFGAELGLSHINRGPVGVSYFLSVTYDNFWTNSTQSLTGSYGGPTNSSLAYFPRVRNTGDPLISSTLTAELHMNRVRIIPQLYYQGPSFYQVGQCEASAFWQGLNGVGTPYFPCGSTTSLIAKPAHLLPELKSNGWWWSNLAAMVDVGPQKDLTLGVQVTNLFNQVNDTAPCWVTQQVNTPSLYPGCAPYYPSSPQSGVGAPNHYTYQNYSETPRQIQIFLSKKLP